MQVTTRTDFELGIATPNLIHHFFRIAVQVPAIIRFERSFLNMNATEDSTESYQTTCFRLSAPAQFFPLARSIDRSDPSARGGSSGKTPLGEPFFPHRKPDLLVFASKCVELSFASIFSALTSVSPRLSYLFVTCHSLALLLKLLPSRRT